MQAYREYTDLEAIQLINQAYAEQKTAWGAVWHMDDMLSSVAAESTNSLVMKMRQHLSEGGAHREGWHSLLHMMCNAAGTAQRYLHAGGHVPGQPAAAWPAVGPGHHGQIHLLLLQRPTESLETRAGEERSGRKRHKTSALPRLLGRSHGSLRIFNGSEVPDRMLVVARAEEDVSWLSLYLPDIPHTVYQVCYPAGQHACDHSAARHDQTAQSQSLQPQELLLCIDMFRI